MKTRTITLLFASNEIAINWNASLVAAVNWLAYRGESGVVFLR